MGRATKIRITEILFRHRSTGFHLDAGELSGSLQDNIHLYTILVPKRLSTYMTAILNGYLLQSLEVRLDI